MKKVLLSIVMTLALLFATNINTNAQIAGNVQGGYSWLNGVVGAELLLGHIGVSTGYFPAKMPGSGESIASISWAVTYYGGLWDESGYYGSIGMASAGYRAQTSYNGGAYGSDVVAPMWIAMVGYKYGSYSGFNLKGGVGYGWCEYAGVFTWEITLGFAFGN